MTKLRPWFEYLFVVGDSRVSEPRVRARVAGTSPTGAVRRFRASLDRLQEGVDIGDRRANGVLYTRVFLNSAQVTAKHIVETDPLTDEDVRELGIDPVTGRYLSASLATQ